MIGAIKKQRLKRTGKKAEKGRTGKVTEKERREGKVGEGSPV